MANKFVTYQSGRDGTTVTDIPEGVDFDTSTELDQLLAAARKAKRKSISWTELASAQEAIPTPEAAAMVPITKGPSTFDKIVDVLHSAVPTKEDLGAAARGVVGGLASPVTTIADPITRVLNDYVLPEGMQQLPPSEALQVLLDNLGVPKAETQAQKLGQEAIAGLASAASGVAAGRVLQAIPGTVGKVGEALAYQAPQQLLGGAAGSAAAEGARQLGAPALVQMGAGLAAGTAAGGFRAGESTAGAAPIEEAKQLGVRLMTSDVVEPKTQFGRWVQGVGEKVPLGTSGLRSAQQRERVAAVKDLVREYGADDFRAVADSVTDDLLESRKVAVIKFDEQKKKVINKLSEAPGKDIPLAPKNDYSYFYRGLQDAYGDSKYAREAYGKIAKKLVDEGLPSPLAVELMDSPVGSSIANAVLKGNDVIKVLDSMANNSKANRYLKLVGWRDPQQIASRMRFESGGGALTAVPTVYATAKIDDQLAYLKSLKTKEVQPVIDKLEDWRNALQDQNLSNIEDLRKQMGESFTAGNLANVKGLGEKAVNSIYGVADKDGIPIDGLRKDMYEYIKAHGTQKDVDDWVNANKQLSKMMQDLKLPAFKATLNRGDVSPATVDRLLFNKDPSEVFTLYNNLSDKGRAVARSAIIAKAAQKAGSGEELSPDKFVAAVKDLGTQTGVFFRDDELRQVKGLVRVMDYTKRAASGNFVPRTGEQLVLPVTTGAAGMAIGKLLGSGDLATNLVVGTAASATYGLLARAYESAPVRTILSEIGKTASHTASEAAVMQRLYEALERFQRDESKKHKEQSGKPY